MADDKIRLKFTLYGDDSQVVGRGVYYLNGNVQVWFKARGDAHEQMQLSDALLYEGVRWFKWDDRV